MSSSKKPLLLNKLTLGGSVWLASDIHLGADNPQTSAAFYQFLAQARHRASALILLGDIFNVWIGDDWTQSPPPWLETALTHLKATGQALPLYLMGGNRDFLIKQQLAQTLHAHLLSPITILDIQCSHPSTDSVNRYLLAHGDEFCTADRAYQRFRRLVRNKTIQSLFLCLPLSTRQRIASRARQASRAVERTPYDPTYDVQDSSLSQLLLDTGIQTCIHGHTHRPGHFVVQPAARNTHADSGLSRWVLPDWEFDGYDYDVTPCAPQTSTGRGGWIELSQNSIKLMDFTHLA